MPKDIEKGMKAGFDAYLTKPINIKEFYSILEHYIVTQATNNNNEVTGSSKLH